MKILLTTLNSKFIHSSLAIRYLKKVSEKQLCIESELKEYTINMHLEDILVELYQGNYDLIVFSTYIWNYKETLDIARQLKKIRPYTKILLGGPEVSFDSKGIINKYPFIDFIIKGEGEITFKEFLENFSSKNKNYDAIDGLIYKNNNRIFENKDRDLIEDLDTIPFPYEKDLKDLDNRIIYYESTRGCPFNCSYCLSSTIKGVRFFSIERVKSDLKFFLSNNVTQVKFVDRTFNAKKDHYFEIIKFLNENDNGITNFHFEITASLLDDEVLEYLKNVREGLFQFEVGVQTTYNETLKSIHRPMEFKSIEDNLNKIVNLSNIHSHLDLIAGLPFESYNRFLESFDKVYSLKPEKLQLGFLKILKGSEMEKKSDEYGLVYNDLPPYQIYFNKFITFDEIILLKEIENLLDLYYNSHKFDFALNFIIQKYYEKPSSFYEEFVEFWRKKNYFDFKHSVLKKYQILIEFILEKKDIDYEIFMEILKFDYISNNYKKIDKLFERHNPSNYRHKCHQFLQEESNLDKYLPEFKNKNAKYIIKRVHFEKFSFNILKYIESGYNDIVNESTSFLFDYSKRNVLGNYRYYKVDVVD